MEQWLCIQIIRSCFEAFGSAAIRGNPRLFAPIRGLKFAFNRALKNKKGVGDHRAINRQLLWSFQGVSPGDFRGSTFQRPPQPTPLSKEVSQILLSGR
jgi:hypothetical protein